MKIATTLTLSLSFEEQLFILAQKMEECNSEEECLSILLSDKNYQIAYSKEKLVSFKEHILFHFIRFRIAFFQKNLYWFQKETLSLINFWLAHETDSQNFLKRFSLSQLSKLLDFTHHQLSIGYTTTLQKALYEESIALDITIKRQLNKLKNDKMVFLNMRSF